ncbi:MAG: DNA mismatch repair endonuclease MutL [Candidatus Woesearchaeota archaeon]
MAKVHLLDKALVSKIAAGEVVERPVSVVKELVENSLDAGATKIEVEVEEGGKGLIRVKDNGTGMEEEDAVLAVESHTTSKIRELDDLFNITTLGFRGEALASIASVAHVKIRTRTSNAMVGTEVDVNRSITEVGCPKGTVVEVRDLFFNIPARRKFVKSIEHELRLILDLVTRYALGFPEVFFRVMHNGKVVLSAPATTDTVGNIANIYGRNLAKQLLMVNFSSAQIEVMGFVSKPGLSKPNRHFQSVLVNKRYVKSKLVSDAVQDAYYTLLPAKRYPVFVLHLSLNPRQIDVNVHPAKKEIKFGDEKKVYDAVVAAVKRIFGESQLIAEMGSVQSVLVTKRPIQKRVYAVPRAEQTLLREQKDEVVTDRLPAMRVLGQLHNTFIVAEAEDGLLLIDQHVAEERVNYERFMSQRSNVATQALLSPIVLEVEPRMFQAVDENRQLLEKLGFLVEAFGNNSVVVRAIPAMLRQERQIILDVFDELEHARNKIDEEKERLLTLRACKASVKANQRLTLPQMQKMINELSRMEMPWSCPHGRPSIIKLSYDEIEKRFLRK